MCGPDTLPLALTALTGSREIQTETQTACGGGVHTRKQMERRTAGSYSQIAGYDDNDVNAASGGNAASSQASSANVLMSFLNSMVLSSFPSLLVLSRSLAPSLRSHSTHVVTLMNPLFSLLRVCLVTRTKTDQRNEPSHERQRQRRRTCGRHAQRPQPCTACQCDSVSNGQRGGHGRNHFIVGVIIGSLWCCCRTAETGRVVAGECTGREGPPRVPAGS